MTLRSRRHLVSFCYLVFCGLYILIGVHASDKTLVAITAVLAYDSGVLALGGVLQTYRSLLEYLGRIRFFSNALAWPYFMSFAVTVSGRCGYVSAETAEGYEFLFSSLFYVICIVFVGREIAYIGYSLRDPQGTDQKLLANLNAGGEIDKSTGCYKTKAPANPADPQTIELSTPNPQTMKNEISSLATSMRPEEALRGAKFEASETLPLKVEFGDCLPR